MFRNDRQHDAALCDKFSLNFVGVTKASWLRRSVKPLTPLGAASNDLISCDQIRVDARKSRVFTVMQTLPPPAYS